LYPGRHLINLVAGLHVCIGSEVIYAAECVKDLGVYLNKHLDMTAQTSRTISTCSLHLRNIGQIHSRQQSAMWTEWLCHA